MGTFSILVDTGCDLTPELIREHDLKVLPISYELDGTVYDDICWEKLSGKDFYDALRNGSMAKTAQINPDTFTNVFLQYAEKKEDLLYIALSGELSGTHHSAQIALSEVKETYPDCNIFIVDSISATVGIAGLVLIATDKRKEGMSVKEVADLLEVKKNHFIGLFTVNDLMHLHRGGRLNKLSALAGSVLHVKPLLALNPDGSLALKDKARGRKSAMNTLVEQLVRGFPNDAPVGTVFITHTDCEDEANVLADMLREAVSVERIISIVMGPVVGTHVGPGALIFAFESPMTRDEYEARFFGGK